MIEVIVMRKEVRENGRKNEKGLRKIYSSTMVFEHTRTESKRERERKIRSAGGDK